MALFKCPGLEVEFRWGAFFAQIRGLGEVWLETRSVLRGYTWAEHLIENGNLILFIGRTHVVMCPAWKSKGASDA